MAFERELLVATQAVRKASLLTRRIQADVIAHRDSTTITKSDSSPVTVGDFAAQTIIINAIKSNFPDDKIVGEESSDGLSDEFVSEILHQIKENDKIFDKQYNDSSIQFTSNEHPLSSLDDVRKVIDCGNYEGGNKGRFWCLDPIDGTKGFLRGDQFAVCLGLIIDGIVQVGCIGCPNLSLEKYGGSDLPGYKEFGYLFSAIKTQGAFYATCSTKVPDWKPIKVRQLKDTSEMISLEGVEKSHSSHDEQSQIKAKLGINNSLHLDSQVKYCLLALGLADVYLRLPIKLSYREKIWDHAAGNTIVLEAGGYHTDSMENLPLDFGKGRTLQTKGVIASSGPKDLHDLIVKTSADVINSRG
ncbi:MET22 [Nakaseomyces glabratus]|uniref:3'(2'),5'-bisphosphate nucleotidase n=1 Tax=Candida glabrata (strain ATCC 2001 / BCRC 20586 / JCM 3761 / NBRC 0622 / NRRL Y-65 / CBS 138) TaxID=284593 RepID=Q6FWJ2_CANGA|nr:uncharacterized protein CAGL0C05247g [Nakaseomyces glabratus]KAH7608741.1 Inositol monophosphatase family [Nakaseomyces glabratus]QHS65031.1 MET22 [Nakaseomyces glabratus]CAG58308.1 unnamed protein product [Nakaseomyces glabratus]|eukprot:XP_445402.1 uncharacterized protein CAGL0C05247g [[Candida] glabrata]